MFDSIKMRFMCGLTAFAVAAGSLSVPVNVWADDDAILDDLCDLSDEEIEILDHIFDSDGDGDVDETEITAVATIITIAAMEEAEEERRKEQEALEELKRQKEREEEERRRSARVKSIWVSSTQVTLNPGQTYQLISRVEPDTAQNKGVSFCTDNGNVASVDGSGIIRANNVGSCIITARSDEGGYQAYCYVRVNPAPAVAAQTVVQDSSWTATAAGLIAAAAPGATLNLVAPKALSFDAAMINALKLRPDVGLLIAYPYNGHAYLMAVPAGYNLAARMDKNGKVSFLSLAGVKDGKIIVTMTN